MIKSPSTNEAPDLREVGGNSSTQNETAAGNKISKLALSNNSTTPARSSTSTSTAAPWMRLSKDPRIVRVSRAFGGKDRHSKVCTVRGLRDRRVRLSVPTAIQLYDLQDRLGLNQPSKVVDWLLDATKDEIDQLPPLPPMPPPPGSFGGRDGGGQMSHHHNPSLMNITASSSIDKSNMWMRSRNDEGEDEENEEDGELGDDDHRKVVEEGGNNPPSTSNNLNYPLFFPGLLNNSNANPPMPSYGFHHNWEDHQSANFPLGFTAHHHHHHHQQQQQQQPTTDNVHNFNVMTSTLPSALSLSTGTTQSYFPDHQNMDVSRFNQLQQMQQHHQNLMASSLYPSSSQHSMQRTASPHNLMSMITKLVHSQPNGDKDHEPPSK